jgi:hypothetical protein
MLEASTMPTIATVADFETVIGLMQIWDQDEKGLAEWSGTIFTTFYFLHNLQMGPKA